MKKIFSISFLCLLISCSNDKKIETETIESETTSVQTQKITLSELRKYNTVKEMLDDAHDFTVEQGTLKFISENEENLHIQVSKPTISGEPEEVINQTVKRDIIYVAFQAFAQTSIKKITITSIPIDNNKTKYYNKYKKTLTITKEKADEIMQKEFGNTDYSILFSKLNTVQVPSRDFEKMKFDDLEKIYSQLLK